MLGGDSSVQTMLGADCDFGLCRLEVITVGVVVEEVFLIRTAVAVLQDDELDAARDGSLGVIDDLTLLVDVLVFLEGIVLVDAGKLKSPGDIGRILDAARFLE